MKDNPRTTLEICAHAWDCRFPSSRASNQVQAKVIWQHIAELHQGHVSTAHTSLCIRQYLILFEYFE